ncbi:MAG TPA: hypothetical protein PKA60_00285 [Candidatus Paceibacterota bacterium]|nr:hypothetical protein [Candidatus Paceibacterota bacterium]
MPSIVREMFIEKRNLTIERWVDLLVSRRKQITQFFDSFTLPELGSFRSPRDDDREIYDLNHDNPGFWGDLFLIKNGDGLFKDIQGIFGEQPVSRIKIFDPLTKSIVTGPLDWSKNYTGVKYLWGITRSAQWVLVKVDFDLEKLHGYCRERATRVEVKGSNPGEILEITGTNPLDIWMTMGRQVDDWTNRRFSQYSEIKRLQNEMNFDNQIVINSI